MQRSQKEQVVAELVERLRSTESLIVADYRGLTNAQLVDLRAKLRSSGAQLQVVKNTLTRRAAEEAGAEQLLALLEGPTAIAFVESRGRPGRRREGARRHGEGHEGPRAARRHPVRHARSRAPTSRSSRSSRRPRSLKSQLVGVIVAPAHAAPGPARRAAARPRRPDRRPDRAARGRAATRRRRRGAGSGRRRAAAEAPVADATADAEAPAEEPVRGARS